MTGRKIWGFVALATLMLVIGMSGFEVYCSITRGQYNDIVGTTHEIISFRNWLWVYHLQHRHPPANLAEIFPNVGSSNVIRFGTEQQMSCYLTYKANASPGMVAVHVRCGDPLFVEYQLAGDGTVMLRKEYPPLWLKSLLQRRKALLRLTEMDGNKTLRPAS